MASPVDTSVKFFSTEMTNAPVLNGVVGTLIGLLDACLVDGFDLKTATSLVVAGGVATLTFTGTHSALKDSVILVAGSSITALNGEQKVTSKSGTTVTFATAAADGTATGTITFKMAPLGFVKAFTGTNLAAYRSTAPGSTGCYLRVNDTTTTLARVIGYETMTDVNTGTGPFPTNAQMSGGGYWPKSSVANATANRWLLAGDSRGFVFFVAPIMGASPTIEGGATRGFGDINAYRPAGDAFGCSLSYSATPTVNAMIDNALDTNNATPVGHAMPRSYTGLGTSTLYAAIPFTGLNNTVSGIDASMGSFPSPVDGSLRFSKRYYTDAIVGGAPRGDAPGIYHVSQSNTWPTFSFGARVSGAGPLAGRTLLAVNPANAIGSASTAGNTGVTLIDITGPWR